MIKNRMDELSDEISMIDPDDIFHYLIDRGKKFSGIPEWANNSNLVPGCMSRLWARTDICNSCVLIRTCSDSMLVDGTARVVSDILNGTPLEQARTEIGELDRLPALLGLSNQRRNGLANLIHQLKRDLSS